MDVFFCPSTPPPPSSPERVTRAGGGQVCAKALKEDLKDQMCSLSGQHTADSPSPLPAPNPFLCSPVPSLSPSLHSVRERRRGRRVSGRKGELTAGAEQRQSARDVNGKGSSFRG